MFRDLEVAANLHMTDVRGEYIVAVLTLLSERNLNKNLIDSVLSFVLRISEQEKAEGGSTNYYNLLGRLYALVGDRGNADKHKKNPDVFELTRAKYKKMGDAIEAERMERYKDLFKATQSN